MSGKLIEAVARAAAVQMTSLQGSERSMDADLTPNERKFYLPIARAAIAAIEASGTHRVVPVEPTSDMIFSGGDAPDYSGVDPIGENTAELIYRLMLDAAPKVAP